MTVSWVILLCRMTECRTEFTHAECNQCICAAINQREFFGESGVGRTISRLSKAQRLWFWRLTADRVFEFPTCSNREWTGYRIRAAFPSRRTPCSRSSGMSAGTTNRRQIDGFESESVTLSTSPVDPLESQFIRRCIPFRWEVCRIRSPECSISGRAIFSCSITRESCWQRHLDSWSGCVLNCSAFSLFIRAAQICVIRNQPRSHPMPTTSISFPTQRADRLKPRLEQRRRWRTVQLQRHVRSPLRRSEGRLAIQFIIRQQRPAGARQARGPVQDTYLRASFGGQRALGWTISRKPVFGNAPQGARRQESMNERSSRPGTESKTLSGTRRAKLTAVGGETLLTCPLKSDPFRSWSFWW